MSDISADLRELSKPHGDDENMPDIIKRLMRATGFKKFSRVYEIYYGRAKRVSDSERVRVAQALQKKREEATRNELHQLRFLLERMESRLSQADPEFHRPSVDAIRDHLRTMDGKRRG